MDTFIQLTLTGLTYKASDVLNFAQGDFLLVGAYITFALVAEMGLPWPVGVLGTMAFAVLLGVVVERFVLRPLIGEPIISVIMVTIGLSSLLRAFVQGIWGVAGRPFPGFIPDQNLQIGAAIIPADRLLATALAGVLLVGFTLFFRYSRQGIAMRATADDQQAALSMGISVKTIFALAWSIAAVTAALGGVLVANIIGVSSAVATIGLRVFPVVILGGLDSIPGAILGGLIIGLLEAYTGGYIGGGLSQVIPFIVLILILMVKPYGLFGEERIERV